MEKKQDLKNKLDSVETNIAIMNLDINDIKSDIKSIKDDIKDIKHNPANVEEHYYLGFWGWLAISSVVSAIASATIGIVKCLHDNGNKE